MPGLPRGQGTQVEFFADVPAAFLRGGDSDFPAIIPGASVDSPLIRFAAGLVEKMQMPPRRRLPRQVSIAFGEELALLRGWIDKELAGQPSRPSRGELSA